MYMHIYLHKMVCYRFKHYIVLLITITVITLTTEQEFKRCIKLKQNIHLISKS